MSFTSSRRDLWLVITAKAISLLGDEVAAVALVLRLQSHGAGPAAVASLLVAAMLPVLLLAGVAGRLVDRFDSRTLLLTSSVTQGLLCVVLAYTSSTVAILVLVAALGAGQSINGSTWQSLLPQIAGPDDLPRAMGYAQMGNTVASIAAPALGGLLTGWYGARIPLLADAATFAAITVAGLLIRTRRARTAHATDGRQVGGLRIVRSDPLLRILFLLLGLFVLLGGMVNVIEVFLIRETLHASSAWYGAAGAAFGVGLLGGAFAGGRRRGTTSLAQGFVLGAVVLAAAILAMSLAPSVLWLLPASAAAGAGNGVLNVGLGSLVMGRATADTRGRVSAILNGVAAGTQLSSYVIGALLSVIMTPREVFAVAGALGLLAPAVFGRALVRAAALPGGRSEPTVAAQQPVAA